MEQIQEVELSEIMVNPYQPRRQFGDEELQELAASIKSVGLIHPPLVRLNGGKYELISGERRFRASVLAGLKKIPVVIRKTDDVLSAEAALIENIQRVDLNPLEVANALAELKKRGMTQEELAQRMGKKRSTIANYLRLLELPKSVQDKLMSGELSMGHAKVILGLEMKHRQELLSELILREQMSVRQAEKVLEKISKKEKKKRSVMATRDFHHEYLEQKLQSHLGTKVKLQSQGARGKLIIDYYNMDDLERLLELLGVGQDG